VAGPDNDLRPGQRRYNVVWYRPAEEGIELKQLLTDATGITHTLSIPPPLIRHYHVAAMRAAAERLLAPQFRVIARLIEQPVLQPIYDLETPGMAFGRVAILGDAAFVARPHVGAGVAKACDDALALADALVASDVEPALIAFEAERIAVGRRVIERARQLGAYLQASQSAAERAHASRYSTAQAVINETALVDFLET
jgi:2-polyprenyl-6-methoxyphenol hydroxylase-like FAD-dependent oxidoreductase